MRPTETRRQNSKRPAERLQDAETPHWSHLPLFGTQIEAKGYRIPLPFGISGTFFNANQPVNVRDLKLGLGNGPPQSAEFAKVDEPIDSWQQNASARLDVWLLPFLNVYG